MCFFSSCGGILELQREIQASSSVGTGKSSLPFELRGRVGDCSRVTAGKKRPHLGLCPGPNVSLQGRQGSPISWRLGDKGAIFLDDHISKVWLPGSWEKHCWVVKWARGFQKEFPVYRRWRKQIYKDEFPKEEAQRKERSGAKNQEEVCLKFRQALSNINRIWDKSMNQTFERFFRTAGKKELY